MRRETRYEEKQIREKPNRPLRCIGVTDNEEDCPNIATALLRLLFRWAEYCFFPMNACVYYIPTLRHSVKSLVCSVVAVEVLRFDQCLASPTNLPSIPATYKDSTNSMVS